MGSFLFQELDPKRYIFLESLLMLMLISNLLIMYLTAVTSVKLSSAEMIFCSQTAIIIFLPQMKGKSCSDSEQQLSTTFSMNGGKCFLVWDPDSIQTLVCLMWVCPPFAPKHLLDFGHILGFKFLVVEQLYKKTLCFCPCLCLSKNLLPSPLEQLSHTWLKIPG